MSFECPLEIEHVSIGVIRTGNRQLRRHDDAKLRKLMRSIEQFGFVRPLVLDRHNRLIDGHAILEAAQRLGFETVPATRLEHLSDQDARLLKITLNRLQELADWDEEALKIEFETLIDLDPEVDLTLTGFELPEIDVVMLGAESDDQAEEDETDDIEPGPPVSCLGDLWQIGSHRLICGDARDPETLAQVLNGARAQAVLSDPPWNVPISGHVGNSGRTQHPEFTMASGEMSEEAFEAFLRDVMANMTDALIEGGLMYLFIDWRHVEMLLRIGGSLGLSLENLIVWNKTNAGMGSFYRSQHELIPLFKKPGASHINNVQLGSHGRYRSNVWTYAGSNSFGAGRMERLEAHPTTKPAHMLAEALLDCTRRGDVVLDSFCGSGSILIAAERVGRIACAGELDPIYVDRALRRFERCFGIEAIHVETGLSFEELAEQRSEAEPATLVASSVRPKPRVRQRQRGARPSAA